MPVPPPSFAELLRTLREGAGLTQEELAERAGLTPHAISALERGARTRPYPHTVRALADGLGLTDDRQAALRAAVPSRRAPGSTTPAGPPPAAGLHTCLLYTSPSPRDGLLSRMPSSA